MKIRKVRNVFSRAAMPSSFLHFTSSTGHAVEQPYIPMIDFKPVSVLMESVEVSLRERRAVPLPKDKCLPTYKLPLSIRVVEQDEAFLVEFILHHLSGEIICLRMGVSTQAGKGKKLWRQIIDSSTLPSVVDRQPPSYPWMLCSIEQFPIVKGVSPSLFYKIAQIETPLAWALAHVQMNAASQKKAA